MRVIDSIQDDFFHATVFPTFASADKNSLVPTAVKAITKSDDSITACYMVIVEELTVDDRVTKTNKAVELTMEFVEYDEENRPTFMVNSTVIFVLILDYI